MSIQRPSIQRDPNPFAQALGWFNVRDFGAVGDGVHDDTAAIQAAINAATNAGGGTIYFPIPPKYYYLHGPLQDTTDRNAVLLLPKVPLSTTTPPVTLEFVGATPAFEAYPAPYLAGIASAEASPVTLYCDTTGSGTSPAVFGGPNVSQTWTNLLVVFRNLTIQQPNNPALVSVATQYVYNAIIEKCMFNVQVANTSDIVEPTNNGIAVSLPHSGNSAIVVMRDCNILGYTYGVLQASCARLDNVFIQMCQYGVRLTGTYYHAATWQPLVTSACTYPVMVYGGLVHVEGFWDIEDAVAGNWYSTVNHIADGAHNLTGNILYHRVLSKTGVIEGPLTVNGSALVTLKQITAPLGAITPPASPLASGTVYQNTYNTPIILYQPTYASTSGTAGSVAVALGSSSTPSTLFTKQIPGSTSSAEPDMVEVRVPVGWYYSFTTTGATLADAQIIGE